MWTPVGRAHPLSLTDDWACAHYSGLVTPEPKKSAPGELHQAREIAESFGREAERYERTRPAYPQEMVEKILATSPGRDFLDVGIGTGISARPFQSKGCHVLGVDPDERMAQYARECGFDVDISKFEDWDPAGRTFDVLISGQAWHWVDPVLGAQKAAAVLRTSGRIALFWNVMSFEPRFAVGLATVYRRVVPEFPFFQRAYSSCPANYAPLSHKAADGIRNVGRFDEPFQWQFDWEGTFSRDQWLDTVPTFGGHSQLLPNKLDELLEGIGRVIDSTGGTVTLNYTTVVVTAILSADR